MPKYPASRIQNRLNDMRHTIYDIRVITAEVTEIIILQGGGSAPPPDQPLGSGPDDLISSIQNLPMGRGPSRPWRVLASEHRASRIQNRLNDIRHTIYDIRYTIYDIRHTTYERRICLLSPVFCILLYHVSYLLYEYSLPKVKENLRCSRRFPGFN